MNWLNENFLVASLIWSSIATGYLVYGWKQKAAIPLAGGAAMMIVSICISSALFMSLASLAIIIVVYWLVRQGY